MFVFNSCIHISISFVFCQSDAVAYVKDRRLPVSLAYWLGLHVQVLLYTVYHIGNDHLGFYKVIINSKTFGPFAVGILA